MNRTISLFSLLAMLFTFVFSSPAFALNSGDIITIAGGSVGDGSPSVTANINNPYGVTVDSSGNLYIVDTGNNRIRKVTTATGIITTVAGNGIRGFSGDNGAATAANLYEPKGVTVDSSGNLYIADSSNNRIRKVTAATGIITTVAGNGAQNFAGDNGVATAASLSQPYGVSVDSSGNLYIADTINHRIRKVTASTGIITTVAGNGTAAFAGDGGAATAASLRYPNGVTIDSSGNIYIADWANGSIRKVDAATGLISTVAGMGTGGFAGDGVAATATYLWYPSAVAVDSSDNLYIADSANFRIRKVNAATGIITTVAGNGTPVFFGDSGVATAASLNQPNGVSVDSSGNLYIADTGNHRIRKVTASTGIITTVAGVSYGDNGVATAASLRYPRSTAVDSSGNLYIADQDNQRIRKVTASTGIITTVAGNGVQGFAGDAGAATAANLNNPHGVIVDSAGNLYIADSHNSRIRKLTAATGIITTIAGNGTSVFAGDGGDGGDATAASISPYGVSVDSSGNLYIADTDNNRIRKVTAATGIITTVAGNGTAIFAGDAGAATAASLNGPSGVTVDSFGDLYIADTRNHRIRKVDVATGIITTVASINDPSGITHDSSGNIYVTSRLNGLVYKVAVATGIITTVAGNGMEGFSGDNGAATAASFNGPHGVTVDSFGNLYIADTGNHRIRKVLAIALPGNTETQLPTLPGQLIITWTKPSDTGFNHIHIYRSTAAGALGTLIADNVTGLKYTDTGLASQTKYYYTVRSVDNAGNESTNTAQVFGTTLDKTPPAVPGNQSATFTGPTATITVAWTKPTDSDLAHIHIYRSTVNGTLGPLLHDNITIASKTDTGLENGTTYYYTIRAVDKLGNETTNTTQVSATVTLADVTGPGAVTNVAMNFPANGNQITLDWTNPVSDFALIRLYRSTTSGQKGNLVYQGTPATFIDTNINPNSTYWYTFDALDTAGNISSFVAPSITPLDTQVPGCIAQLKATPLADAKIQLTWLRSPSTDLNLFYDIYGDNGSDIISGTSSASTTHPVTEWTSATLNNGTTYQYAIKVADGAGNTSATCATAAATALTNPSVAGVSASIKIPYSGKKYGGNQLQIMAEQISGSVGDLQKIQFEYYNPIASQWQVIPVAGTSTTVNPDTTKPYFIHWDVTGMTNGDYKLRAVATDINNFADGTPGFITVTINNASADVTQNAGNSQETVNSTSGGSVATTNASITVPAGTYAADATVTINTPDPATKAATVPASHDNAQSFHDITTTGTVTGENSIAVEIPYADADNNLKLDTAPLISVLDLKICRNISGQTWTCLDSTVDTSNKVVRANTTTLGLMALLVPPVTLGQSNWNMASVALTPDTPTPAGVFGVSGNNVKTYNPTTQAYQLATSVQPGIGYYVWGYKSLKPKGTEITTATFSTPIKKGWNIIGNPYKGNVLVKNLKVNCGTEKTITQSETDGEVVGTFFHSINGAYQLAVASNNTDTIDPWKGYWLLSDKDCNLIFSKP